MKNILFICSQNQWRSPTGEAIFADHPSVEATSAGLNHDATVPLSPEQLKAADIIFVMEKTHRTKLSQRFGKYLNGQKIVTLHIPDHYQYMDPSLVELLKQKVSPHL